MGMKTRSRKPFLFLAALAGLAASAASIEHIALEIEDPASMVKWWSENLGFKVTLSRPGGSTFIEDEAGRVAFELYRPSEGRKAPDYKNMSILQLHFGLFSDDVDADVKRLVAAGATEVAKDEVPGLVGVTLRDPNGLAFQVMRRAKPVVDNPPDGGQGAARPAKAWVTEGFEAFRRGTFGNAGQNLYVSKAGVLQRIYQYDLDKNGYFDLVFANCQNHHESAPSYIYALDGKRVATLPGQGTLSGLVADLNGDGIEDVILAGYYNLLWNFVSSDVYYGQPDGSYNENHQIRLQTPSAADCSCGRFDGSKKPSLAFAMPKFGIVRLYGQSELGFEWARFTDLKVEADLIAAGDFDGDGFDEIGVGSAALDHDGTVLWTSGFGHGDAHHLGDFDPNNEGLEIFYVNEEWKESPLSSVLFDAATGGILKSHPQDGMDTGRGLAADLSAAHRGAEMITKGDDDTMGSAANGSTFRMQYTDGTPDWVGGNGERAWQNGSLYVNYVTQDEFGQDVTNTVASYPNFRIYWDGDLLDEWLDSRHVDKMNDETLTWERVYTFDSPSHTAHSINGTKENPNLITDLFGDWREEVIFYDYDVTGTTMKSVTSKSENNGEPFDYEWEQRQFYLTVFTTTIPTEHSLPWLRDDHAYDMSIAWQNVGYNQPPHLSYSPLERMNGTEQMVTVTISSVGVSTYSNKTAVDFSQTGSDLIVYAANLNAEETAVTLTPIASKQIPANTAVILVGEAGKIYEGVFTDEAEAVSSNMQAAPFNITVGTDDQFLGLGVKDGQPIFAKMKAGATIKARTGYFQYLRPATTESRAIRILFEETTGISTVNSEEVKAKSEVHDLLGRKVSQPGPGLYIQNGRKIIIK